MRCCSMQALLFAITLGVALSDFQCLLPGDPYVRFTTGRGVYRNNGICFDGSCGGCAVCTDSRTVWGDDCPGDGSKTPCPAPACSAGKYARFDPDELYYCPFKCVDCLLGHYCVGASAQPVACSVSSCAAGTYAKACSASSDSNECFDCPAGSFCFGNKAYICPQSSTSQSKATRYLDCTCIPGYWGSVYGPGNASCIQCEIGKFCPGVNPALRCNC
jgi:hypothetical protein